LAAAPFLHDIRDKARTKLFQEPRKDEISAKPEGVSGIRDRDLKEQLRLGSDRTFGRIYRKTLESDIVQ
jgi:hypothetical protein